MQSNDKCLFQPIRGVVSFPHTLILHNASAHHYVPLFYLAFSAFILYVCTYSFTVLSTFPFFIFEFFSSSYPFVSLFILSWLTFTCVPFVSILCLLFYLSVCFTLPLFISSFFSPSVLFLILLIAVFWAFQFRFLIYIFLFLCLFHISSRLLLCFVCLFECIWMCDGSRLSPETLRVNVIYFIAHCVLCNAHFRFDICIVIASYWESVIRSDMSAEKWRIMSTYFFKVMKPDSLVRENSGAVHVFSSEVCVFRWHLTCFTWTILHVNCSYKFVGSRRTSASDRLWNVRTS